MSLEEVQDLAIDSDFNVFLNHRGDLETVSGRDAFEQELVIRLTREMRPLIGRSDVDTSSIVELAESKMGRIAGSMDELDSLSTYSASLADERKGTVLEIEAIYDTGEVLQFEVEG